MFIIFTKTMPISCVIYGGQYVQNSEEAEWLSVGSKNSSMFTEKKYLVIYNFIFLLGLFTRVYDV